MFHFDRVSDGRMAHVLGVKNFTAICFFQQRKFTFVSKRGVSRILESYTEIVSLIISLEAMRIVFFFLNLAAVRVLLLLDPTTY